jgi:hypothetical protein
MLKMFDNTHTTVSASDRSSGTDEGQILYWDRFDLAISNFCLDRSYRASCLPDLSELSELLVGEGEEL